MINYILQSETGYGEQAWYLRAHSTIPQVLDCTNSLCTWNCRDYIKQKPFI